MEICGLVHAPATLNLKKSSRCALDKKLDGPNYRITWTTVTGEDMQLNEKYHSTPAEKHWLSNMVWLDSVHNVK